MTEPQYHVLQVGDKVTLIEQGKSQGKTYRLEGGELKEVKEEPPAPPVVPFDV